MIVVAFCLATSTEAQTAKTKKAKTTKHVHTAKYQCPMKCEGEKTYKQAGKCPVCKMNLKKLPATSTAAAYQCPMNCEGTKTYAKEGKCPVCNMNLKKVATKKGTSEDEKNHKHS